MRTIPLKKAFLGTNGKLLYGKCRMMASFFGFFGLLLKGKMGWEIMGKYVVNTTCSLLKDMIRQGLVPQSV